MGYIYPGYGLRTKIDFSRQVYQNCNSYAHLSGHTIMDQTLQVMSSGYTGIYNFNFVSTSANTAVMSIGQVPDLTYGKSGIQINPSILPNSTGVDLEINTSNGEVYANSSSLRYKDDIKPLSPKVLKAVLELIPVSFNWKSNGKRAVGLIAEQVHEKGLHDFVIYNENCEPEAINYKLLTIALISVMQNTTIPSKAIENDLEPYGDIPVTVYEDYSTQNTKYIITEKDLIITLDDTLLKRFYIKSMSNITVKPKHGLIDNEWSELEMGPQSSVEVLSNGVNWYILSSDGLKNI